MHLLSIHLFICFLLSVSLGFLSFLFLLGQSFIFWRSSTIYKFFTRSYHKKHRRKPVPLGVFSKSKQLFIYSCLSSTLDNQHAISSPFLFYCFLTFQAFLPTLYYFNTRSTHLCVSFFLFLLLLFFFLFLFTYEVIHLFYILFIYSPLLLCLHGCLHWLVLLFLGQIWP